MKGYKNILDGMVKVATNSKFSQMENGNQKAKANPLEKLNKNVFIDLLLLIIANTDTGQITFQIVKDVKTNELSDVDARVAWK